MTMTERGRKNSIDLYELRYIISAKQETMFYVFLDKVIMVIIKSKLMFLYE